MPNTHVTSLELSRRLRELKVPQTAYFDWYLSSDEENTTRLARSTHKLRTNENDYCSAYLASELGEMLKTSDYYLPYTSEDWSIWECRVGNTPDGEKQYLQADTECNARAKMLIHLLENHLISVEELGK